MANFLSPYAVQAQKALRPHIKIKHTVVLEVLAACLGYQTLNALIDEEKEQGLPYHLGNAEIIVLNQPLGQARAATLCDNPDEILPKCVEALEHCMNARVFRSVEAFYIEHGIDAVDRLLNNNTKLIAGFRSRWRQNGKLVMTGNFDCAESLWSARTCWTIKGEALWAYEGQKEPNGNAINGFLMYRKAGRAGLMLAGNTYVGDRFGPPEIVVDWFSLDAVVSSSEGVLGRPTVAIVVNTNSGVVLGCAVSTNGDKYQLMADSISEALGGISPYLRSQDAIAIPAHQFIIGMGPEESAARLSIDLSQAGFMVHQLRQMPAGLLERLVNRLNKSVTFYRNEPQFRAIYSLANLKLILQSRITGYNHLIQNGDYMSPIDRWNQYMKLRSA
jgi:hypothetical protein